MTNQQLLLVLILIACAFGAIFYWGKTAQRRQANNSLAEKDQFLLEKDQIIEAMGKELNHLRLITANPQRPYNGLA